MKAVPTNALPSGKQPVVWCTSLGDSLLDIHRQILKLAAPGDEMRPLLVDLTEAEAIDGRKLQLILALAAETLQQGRHFEIVNAGRAVVATFEQAGLGYLLTS